MDSALLAVEGIVKRFRGAGVLRGISLALAPGESLGLAGPNGSGKTTLLDIISGFLRPDEGRVRLEDRDFTGWEPYRIVRAGIARTFQLPHLAFRMTVEENIRAATLFRRMRPRVAREAVDRVLGLTGLEALRQYPARTLSQGQIRRIEIARALATGPRILLLDEPFASLSPGDIPEVLSALRRLRAEGASMLIVAHSRALFQALCNRVAVIRDGRMAYTGAPGGLPDA